MRVKAGPATRAKHKKIVRAAKGMQRSRRTSSRLARQATTRALQYAYRDRRARKRDFRSLWITRINAAARAEGSSYAALMADLKRVGIKLDRKILAELAVNQPSAFKAVVEASKKVQPSPKTTEKAN